MRQLVNLSLGISSQAMAVLHALHEQETQVDVANARTAAWYNGRERGIVLCLDRYAPRKSLCIAFYGCRTSDHIGVTLWEQDTDGLNPPSSFAACDQNAFGRGYEREKSFKVGEYNEAATYIEQQVQAWLERTAPKRKPATTKLRRVK